MFIVGMVLTLIIIIHQLVLNTHEIKTQSFGAQHEE